MRKLTGYIGAMIIVFALMGSILAGYALNINGQTVVYNDYESITDVSGLYTHSTEKTYIDYNPASNYIGYNTSATFNSDSSVFYHKLVTENTTITVSVSGVVTYKGVTYNPLPYAYNLPFVCDKAYLQLETTGVYYWSVYTNSAVLATTDITIIISGNTVTFSFNGGTDVFNGCTKKIVQTDNTNYDYHMIYGRALGNSTSSTAYYTDVNQMITLSRVRPYFSMSSVSNVISVGSTYHIIGSNDTTITRNDTPYTNTSTVVYDNVKSTDANYTSWGADWETPPETKVMDGWFILYPASVTVSEIGINYTESNRVNNYPIETDYNTSSTTSTGSVDLQAYSGANYGPTSEYYYYAYSTTAYGHYLGFSFELPRYSNDDLSTAVNSIHTYRLSDVLTTVNIPSGTTSIQITGSTYNLETRYFAFQVDGDPWQTVNIPYPVFNNWSFLVVGNDSGNWGNYNQWLDRTAYYYPDSGIVEIYKNGVKVSTTTADDVYLFIVDNSATYGKVKILDNGANRTGAYDASRVARPYINLIYTTQGTVTNVHYSDITKGYSIKASNINSVIWNNEYENGDIKILFRAENNISVYHNDLTVGSNNISIDYDGARFYVTLNGGDPVDIGTWRNIVLDIDLIQGRLSVIPVRTFNSFTNVVMDNASVTIGNLTNPQPTNTISWGTTSNSLLFNIYSTNVFMDTYGVVMVDPSLNVTNYFTNLDNFYKLRLYNFSVYGDSITINGVTGTVSGNLLTINNETVTLKDMSIIYADGNAYVEDNNVSIDLGAIADNVVSMSGVWYFQTQLYDGFTDEKLVYEWDWSDFILDNVQFVIIYMGLAIAGLIIARKYCTMSIIDYAVFIVSIVIALTVQVIA